MEPSPSFNVQVLPPSNGVFNHVATVDNSYQNYTLINHPLTNGNPAAILEVTQILNPGSVQYNNAAVGVWYNSFASRWGIFNEDYSTMPQDAAFNVKVASECVGLEPPEACCFLDGTCLDLPPDTCLAEGGDPKGPGSSCGTTSCPELGACCYWGTCYGLTDEGGCRGPDEIWYAGQTCDEITCPPPPPTGACCALWPCTTGGTCQTGFPTCDGDFACGCFQTYEGGATCLWRDTPCDGGTPCPNGTGDCPEDEVCVVNTCCGEPLCVLPVCVPEAARAEPDDGPTVGGTRTNIPEGEPAECAELTSGWCEYEGGGYQGDYTVCTPNTCPECADNEDCNDGLFCNGAEICAEGVCTPGAHPCSDSEWCYEAGLRCIAYGSGDFEPDGDVDLWDFHAFQECLGAWGLGPCGPGQMIGHGVIDLDDYVEFEAIITGP
jgi:hypothetical protein